MELSIVKFLYLPIVPADAVSADDREATT